MKFKKIVVDTDLQKIIAAHHREAEYDGRMKARADFLRMCEDEKRLHGEKILININVFIANMINRIEGEIV